MSKVCRLCGASNKFGTYCDKCVENSYLRTQLNRFDPDKTNMMLLDFRARNGLSYRAASGAIQLDETRWKIAELYPKQGLTRSVMTRIADYVGIKLEVLFNGYVELRAGSHKSGKINGVIGKVDEPPKVVKPKKIHLPPGVSQKLLAQDSREAAKAGYGHSYGLWRAGVII